MNNTQKDRYENKLARFIKEHDQLWRKARDERGFLNIQRWEELQQQLQKQYGFTDTDCQRAFALHRHHSDRHYWCDTEFHKGEQKQNKIDKAERRMKRSDESLEAELKAEQDLILDIYDN